MTTIQVLCLVLGFGCGCFLAEICPTDWHRYGDSCYFVKRDTVDWYEANRICAESRADLAIQNPRSVQDYTWELFLKGFEQMPPKDLWIGCNDIEEEGKLQHCPLKGDTFDTLAYGYNWATEADCEAFCFAQRGTWDDQSCDFDKYSLCEVPVNILHAANNTPIFCMQTGKDGRLIIP